jgi:hypothetical protein
MVPGFVHRAELQAGRLSLRLEATHVLDPEDDLDLRSALLGSSGLMESDGSGAVRAAELEPAILRSRQRFQAEVLLIERGQLLNVPNIQNDPGDRQRLHGKLVREVGMQPDLAPNSVGRLWLL